jgi:uncharacterized protein YbdZ (MbtH family)
MLDFRKFLQMGLLEMRRRAFARTASQADELRQRGYDVIYEATELRDFLKAMRPGEVYGVDTLAAFADAKIKSTPKRRRSLWEALNAVPAGAVIEDGKGRRSDRDCVAMISEAVEDVTQSRKADAARRNGEKSKGRPKSKLRKQIEAVRPIWESRKYTPEEAVKRMPEGWTVRKAYWLLGPRG